MQRFLRRIPGINAQSALLCLLGALACGSDEIRARRILESDTAGLLSCYRGAMASVDQSYDAMLKGNWEDAARILPSQARQQKAQCLYREQALLARKMQEAGVPEDVAARAYESWWQEKRKQVDAKEPAGRP